MNQQQPIQRLYLDHASTSWPKRDGVIEAMTSFMLDCGASASRGSYTAARQAGAIVDRVRHRLATIINAESPDCISFHSGCTAALNVGIHGLIGDEAFVSAGHHVLTSAAEHNAVLRPVREATRRVGIDMQISPTDSSGRINVNELLNCVREETRLVAITHASNVTGIVQPLEEISGAIKQINQSRTPENRVLILCDAAQTFGYLPIDVSKLGVDVLAAPAHKGCGGPVGIAMLYLHPRLHDLVGPWMQGGSGHDGLSDSMPAAMPGKLEPGTINVPVIAGWEAALTRFDPSRERMSELSKFLHDRLRRIAGMTVFGMAGELPIASFTFGPILPPSDAAAILDIEFGIDVRAGYHCAAAIHEGLGSAAAGTIRASCGHETTTEDIDRLAIACEEIAESLV